MRLIFLGDYCNASGSEPELSTAIRALFESADLVSVNLEAPIVSTALLPESKTGPSIRQPVSALQICKSWGITHYALANNHIMDYGPDGLHSTMKHLEGLSSFGAGLCFEQAYQPCWFQLSGLNIALFTFAEAQFGVLQDDELTARPGYAWFDHPRARQAIRDARESADWVIVQIHAGLEMVDMPLPEWRIRFREFVDLGADLVIGHHPHVVQGSECYKGKMIYYSLGNFYMDIMLRQNEPGSGAVLQVIIDSDGMRSEMIMLQASIAEINLDESELGRNYYRNVCEKLKDDASYNMEIQNVCIDFWNTIYSGYYESALFGLGVRPGLKSAWKVFRRLLRCVIKGQWNRRANELMLVHNIRIETHRWVVERALNLRLKG